MALLTRLGMRDWPVEDARRYLGDVEKVYLTYADDTALRARSASGGSVSGLLIHMLESGRIDGALVLTLPVEDGRTRPKFIIARNRQEVMSAQGSKYIAVHFAAHAMPLIREFSGRLAVVALPCDARLLHRAREKDAALDEKVKMVITLVCGHNTEPELTDAVVRKIGGDHGPLKSYHYRSGHWRGHLTAEYADGTVIEKPFSTFSLYRNLYFFTQRKCHHCHDHFGYYCDISAGDIWSMRMRKEPIKHTALLARTERGIEAIDRAVEAGVLRSRDATEKEILDGQSRTAPFHYNITARKRVGKLFREEFKDTVHAKVRWPDYLVALIALGNQKFSRTRVGRRIILATPRPILKAYLYVLKILELI